MILAALILLIIAGLVICLLAALADESVVPEGWQVGFFIGGVVFFIVGIVALVLHCVWASQGLVLW